MAVSPAPETILTVGALTQRIKGTLAEAFPAVWVKGELSGVRQPPSGHLYFCLKDGTAQLDAVMFRLKAARLGFTPKDGMEVEAFGGITVYELRGKYQLIADELRPGGLGALLLALEERKRKLAAEGLFDASRKRPLPRYPMRIGVVTSAVGAAVRDVVKVLRARWPGIGIVLAPVRVQGPGAAEEIAAAIARFNRFARVDLLIVGRGGGSLEDLWAFNEEIVARAIAGSRLPVISAVGHEVDTTLADLAADLRAATPSNAAEIAVRDAGDVGHRVEQLDERMRRALRQQMVERRRRLEAVLGKYGFRRHEDVLRLRQQQVDELFERIGTIVTARLEQARRRLIEVRGRYGLREWRPAFESRRDKVTATRTRLVDASVAWTHARRTAIEAFRHRLEALSPRAVLERGFCLARRPDGSLVRSAAGLTSGDLLALEFGRGGADTRVEKVHSGGDDGR